MHRARTVGGKSAIGEGESPAVEIHRCAQRYRKTTSQKTAAIEIECFRLLIYRAGIIKRNGDRCLARPDAAKFINGAGVLEISGGVA